MNGIGGSNAHAIIAPRLVAPDFEKACVPGQHAKPWRFVPSCAASVELECAVDIYIAAFVLKLEKFGRMAS